MEAFEGCTKLKTVTTAGPPNINGAFKKAVNLETVILKNGVVSIGNPSTPDTANSGAFTGMAQLKKVELPPTAILVIGSYAFKDCVLLSEIGDPTVTATPNTINAGDIWDYAFEGCTALKAITLPASGYTSIGKAVFRKSGLESISIPDLVTAIGESAFEGCEKLATVKIGTGLATISGSAFAGCTSLKSFGVSPTGANANKVIIPSIVGTAFAISADAFKGCSSIEYLSVITNASTSSLDLGAAFKNCSGLLTLDVSGIAAVGGTNLIINTTNPIPSIKEVKWDSARTGWANLTGCTGLETLTLSKTLVGAIAAGFMPTKTQAPKFKTLYLWKEDQDVADAFAVLDGVTKVIISTADDEANGTAIDVDAADIFPDTVKEVYFKGAVGTLTNTFDGLDGITVSIDVPATPFEGIVDTIETFELRKNASTGIIVSADLKQYVVDPENSTLSAVNGVLYNKAQTEILNYPKAKGVAGHSYEILGSATAIGDVAFAGVSRLSTLTIPEKVTTIGDNSFLSVTNLTTINYKAKKLTSLLSNFPASLVNMNIENGVTDIIASFLGSTHVNVKKITIPESVQAIDADAFKYMSALESVTLNANLTTTDAFNLDAPSPIKTVTIGPNVTRIKYYTFRNAIITSLDLKNVVVIEEGAFADTSLNSLVIPASVEFIGDNAFNSGTINTLQEVVFAKAGVALGDDVFPAGGASSSVSLKTAYESTDPDKPGGAGRYVNGVAGTFGWEKRP